MSKKAKPEFRFQPVSSSPNAWVYVSLGCGTSPAQVPRHLYAHRREFRRIGKNLFVEPAHTRTRSIDSFIQKMSTQAKDGLFSQMEQTLAAFKKSQDTSTTRAALVKATPDQVKKYEAADAKLIAWCRRQRRERVDATIKFYKRRADKARAEMNDCQTRIDSILAQVKEAPHWED